MSLPVREIYARWAKHFAQRLEQRPDSEHEQALVRVVIGFLATAYVTVASLRDGILASHEVVTLVLGILFTAFAISILAAIVWSTSSSPVRRVLCITVDLGITTAGLLVHGARGAPFIVFYLWVILGNGIRFGAIYLYIAAAVSLVGFGSVAFFTPYWSNQPPLVLAMVLLLVVLPVYVGGLLRRLNKAKAQAEEASRVKGRFLANMSHEVRTPLNGILGVTHLLMTTNLTAEQRDYVQTADASVRALMHLVNDVIDLSRLEAGVVQPRAEQVDLHELLRTTTTLFRPQVLSKGLSLSLEVDPQLPISVLADGRRIQQILNNLLGNAVKFTEHGSIAVKAISQGFSGNSVSVRFEVVDTGIGIPEEARDRVFERFSQADDSVTRLYGGAGLGMAISRELVELLGGSIDFRSTAGQGSSFWFVVPVRPITPAQTPTPYQHSPDSTVRALSPRILIVGASVAARGAYSTWLGRWGFEVVACDSAAQSITRLASAASTNRPYELVLVCAGGIDLVPGEFRSMVHSDPRLNNVPLVLVGEENATRAAKSGFVAVVPPPASQPLLFNAIHFALGEQRRSPGVVDFGECRIQRPLKSRGLRVLLAEDTAVNRQVVGRSLEKAGHRVHVVSDGELALEELESKTFDVAIIDLHMPGLGGLEVARAYQYMCAGKKAVPLLALTADALPGVKEQCMGAGFAAYITKPVDPANLLAALESLAALGHAEPTVEGPGPEEDSSTDTEVLLNPDTLATIADLDEDGSFAAELFESFQRDGEAALAALERSFRLTQWGLFRETLRGLYGSASSLGARRLWRVCSRAEAMSERELESGGGQLLEEIRKAFEETRMALPVHSSYKSWRGGTPGAS